jgi:hypothetical protein
VIQMSSDMTPLLWKALNEFNDRAFRESARKNYITGTNIDFLWHPVYVHECYLMNRDAGILKSE